MFLAHVNSLQASIFSSFAILSLLLTFVMLGSHWLRNYVYAFAAQSWLIAGLSASVGYFGGYKELYAIAVLTALFRGLVLPYLLMRIIDRLNVKREVHAILQSSSSLVIGAFAVMFAFVIANHMNHQLPPAGYVVVLALTIMLSMKFLGFLMLSVRNEAVSQILALLVLENGIFLGSQILVPGMPMLIDVACFGMLVRFLVVHAGTTSSRELQRLVG
jgi:hydrogenase-4 component E